MFILFQDSRYTAIFFAAEKGHIEIFKELLANGADIEMNVSMNYCYATCHLQIIRLFRE